MVKSGFVVKPEEVSNVFLTKLVSGVATGGMGGSGPPTSVQTPPEICENPLRSVLCIGGGGVSHACIL